MKYQAKVPGSKMCIYPLHMNFNYADYYGVELSDDYETLLLDCMVGDQTLFWSKKGIEISWELITPLLREWESSSYENRKVKLYFYKAGTTGPEEADRMIENDNRKWILN